jgi:hypothetical protein
MSIPFTNVDTAVVKKINASKTKVRCNSVLHPKLGTKIAVNIEALRSSEAPEVDADELRQHALHYS